MTEIERLKLELAELKKQIGGLSAQPTKKEWPPGLKEKYTQLLNSPPKSEQDEVSAP